MDRYHTRHSCATLELPSPTISGFRLLLRGNLEPTPQAMRFRLLRRPRQRILRQFTRTQDRRSFALRLNHNFPDAF